MRYHVETTDEDNEADENQPGTHALTHTTTTTATKPQQLEQQQQQPFCGPYA